MTCWGKIATSERATGTRGGKRGAGVHQGEQKKAGGMLSVERASRRKAHRELQDRGDDGEGGLRASMKWRGTMDSAKIGRRCREGAEKAEAALAGLPGRRRT